MRDLLKRLQRLFVVRLALEYGNSQAGNYASVIAFNAFMTMFPLILGVLAVLGLVLRDAGLQAQVERSVIAFFPDSTTKSVQQALLIGVRRNAGLLGILSVAGLLWTGTNFFAALEFALDRVYGIKQRDLLHQRLMGLGMLVAFVAAMLLAVGATAVIAVLHFVPFVGLVIGAASMILLLLLIYWVVPNRRQRWSEVWPGAVLSGALIEILTLVWPVYANLMHTANTYGQTFGLFLVLATWLYLLSSLIVLGAVLNELRLNREPVPEPEQPPARTGGQDAHGRGAQVEARREGHV